MKITGLDSVCLWSENPEKLANFYKNTLKLPFDKELNLPKDKGFQFKIGDIYFFVGYHDKVSGKSKDPYRIMIDFSVDSVRKTYKELVKKGVKFSHPPFLSPDKTLFVATAYDPEGNIIQFYSNKP